MNQGADAQPTDRDGERRVHAPDPTAAQIAALADAVRADDGQSVVAALSDLHPADAANLLDHLPADDVALAADVAPESLTAEVVLELADDTRAAALKALGAERVAEIISDLDSDDAVYLIEELSEVDRASVLRDVDPKLRRDLVAALAFDEETAARLAQREVVAAPEFWSVGQMLDFIRRAPEDTLPETFFEVYVVDPGFKPIGAITLSQLMRAEHSTPLRDLMREPDVLITPETDQEDIAHVFNKYHLAQAPLVDASGRLDGMITVDDIVDVIQDENEEDLLALANVNVGGATSSAWKQFRARAPWLVVNLGTALAASAVIAIFADTIDAIVALAILMPIVAALGGNAGGQALAVSVRAIASRELTAANAPRMVLREALTALANGVLISAMLAVSAGIWFSSGKIAVVIGVAMLVNFLCAGLAGILVPLAMRRMGADPAVASSVFVTTLTDVIGFFVFLGLATLVLIQG